ncbi:MAG: hypothetical protein A2289_12495 [Deltaproteobacteria bacterium RIFOXYA12_FULL_58_15]|nr:MAG: hypothetical protein A2289_12495 [Deltaproteobacteria bacterium RIFOXYA12_FULL_58_15]OGR13869.1 MAG: hypothetical protein A2341_25765 [Deltaproteobacteria bacterium RIFOXYB12_FULL_58_9]
MTPRITVFALFAAMGCSSKIADPPSTLATRLFQHEILGVSFEIPDSWQITTEPTATGTVLVFSSLPGSPSHFSTTTLQARPADTGDDLNNASLEGALVRAHAEVVKLSTFAWHQRDPILLAGKPALRYGLEVELHESRQLKHGVLCVGNGLLYNLAYSATPEIFALGIADFEQILHTITID